MTEDLQDKNNMPPLIFNLGGKKTTFKIFLTNRKLNAISVIHINFLLYSAFISISISMTQHYEWCYRHTIHRILSTLVKEKTGMKICVIPDRNCIYA